MSPEIPDAVRQLLIQFAETGSIEDDLQQLAQSLPDARHHQIAFCELLAMASEWADDPLNWLLSGIQQGRWLVSPEQQMYVLQALYRDGGRPLCWRTGGLGSVARWICRGGFWRRKALG